MNLWERLERGSAERGAPAVRGWALHAPRVALGLLLALATYALFPAAAPTPAPLLAAGAVAPENVIAPFAFGVPKDAEALRRERAAAAAAVLPPATAPAPRGSAPAAMTPAESLLLAARRDAAARAVDTVVYQVQAGEKIVGAHEVVAPEDVRKLRALRAAVRATGMHRSAGRAIGALLVDVILIVALGVTLALFRPLIYRNARAMALVAGVLALTLVGAAVVARAEPMRVELIPVALGAVVFGVVFDARISVLAALLMSILVSGQEPYRGTNALFVTLLGGVAAAFATRLVRRRNDAFYPIAIIVLAYALAAVTVGLANGWDGAAVVRSAGWGAANAVGCVSIALMLMPALEEFTGIDTYPKLLEWSDLNRPLLRRLSLEAPGTYNHTVQIANLAEAACTAIGANGLLARVGAYYHDIGKLRKPQYFVENQQGRNPHDKLKASQSASIIRNHVREGIELAEEAGVPASVRAFIAEHHGTGPISYFLERARDREGAAVNAADFSYPGPVPQTAERAVCMLADGVEAATRALSDPTPAAIREVIERIVRQRIDQGQLRDAPLTLRQLEIVKDQFARMLVASYHQRVDYPTEGRTGASARPASAPTASPARPA